MEKGKYYQWFVEPKNDSANEIIGKALVAIGEICESLALLDSEEIPHSVFQVPNYAFVTRLYKSNLKSPSDFAVFQREGHDSPIRFWSLGVKKRKVNGIK
jgi:hypothetical protein